MSNTLPKIALDTEHGRLEVVLYEADAPNAVASLLELAEQGFYTSQKFFSSAPAMRLHFGRNAAGEGCGYHVEQEPSPKHLFETAGMVGLSLEAEDNGSEFFIALEALPHLDGATAVVGQVVSGNELLPQLKVGSELRSVKILREGTPREVQKTVLREPKITLSRR